LNAYFISGLGADKRAFQKIKLPNRFEAHHIEWIDPLPDETLPEYAVRLASQIDLKKPFVLIGLSFGGMLVSELADKIKPERSIIISSIQNSLQLPWYLRTFGKLGIHHLVPTFLIGSANAFTFWMFGISDENEKQLIRRILKDSDKKFSRWAMNAIIKWRKKDKSKNLFHIHGTNDKILPLKFTEPDVKIEGGGHFMVLSMSESLNKILESELNQISA
jgi:pimeloyl-ACP methyl ester carboxylesterase